MRRNRGPGGFIGGSPLIPSTVAAPGIWTPNDAAYYLQQTANNLLWPTAPDANFSSVTLLCHFNEWSPTQDLLLNKASGGHSNVSLNSSATLSAVQAKFRQLSGRTTATGGNASFIAGTDAGFNYGSGDFTFELWTYPTSVASGVLWDQRPNSTNGLYPSLYLISSGNLSYFTNSADRIIATGALLTVNAWNHVAVCKASGVTRLFVGGVQTGGNFTDGNTYLQGPITIGNSGFAAGASMAAYYQEARVTKGFARYTANFSVPTSPFADY